VKFPHLIFPVLLPVGLVSGCGGLQSKLEELTSIDGVSQITMPAGWSKRTDLNDKAELQIGSDFADCYVIVLTEAKPGFHGFTLEICGKTIHRNFTSSLKNVERGGS